MRPALTRRAFLHQTVRASAALAAVGFATSRAVTGIEPIPHRGRPRLLLSLAAYSFRDYFVDSSHAQAQSSDPSKRLDLFEFIDFCAEHNCAGTELTSYYFPKNLTEDFLLRLKRHAFVRGVAVSGTAVGNDFTVTAPEARAREMASVKTWIDRAALLGAPHIRVFAGSAKGVTKEEAKKLAIAALQESCAYAATKGVFLGLENHGGIVAEADDLLDIVRAVQSPWFGVNLDTGNFQTDDPYGDLAKCAAYAVNVQIKTEIQRRGEKKQLADLPRLARILREANYQGYVALEYEAAEDPWTAVPRTLSQLHELFRA